ncbi:MAG TPA: MXAN_5187 C-terminal domain-containing protein [Thermoanaerobaculia bacterium]|nr:MXAN_5187 C-terminal domain-containing protein [Thermoanaerobaculia bacterium]
MIKQDEELDKLEEDIRKLKVKYEMFFMGNIKMPPQHERHQVEVYIFELGKQKMRENGRRFRYNQLLSRYNQLREMWGRKMREREEGPLDFRRRKAALEAPSAHAPKPTAPHPRVTSASPESYVKLGAGSNGDEIRHLYTQIEQEHQKLGKMPNLTYEQLRTMIEKQSEQVRARYNVDVVGFRVDVVDGKVKLKAKPIQE